MKKKRKHTKRRLRVFLIIVGLASVIFILMMTPLFNITSVDVIGSTRYTPDKIKELSGLQLGENGFRKLNLAVESILELRILDSEEKIERLPYVKSCKVSLDLPNNVSIKISERQPAAYIRYLDNYLTVDNEGFVLEVSGAKPEGDLMEIRGIEFSKYILGGQLEASDIKLIIRAVDIIKTIKESDGGTTLKLYEVLDWIDMVDKNNAILSLDNRIIVRFNPQDNLQYTIDFTREIFFKKINAKETGRLEFSGEEGPSFIPE